MRKITLISAAILSFSATLAYADIMNAVRRQITQQVTRQAQDNITEGMKEDAGRRAKIEALVSGLQQKIPFKLNGAMVKGIQVERESVVIFTSLDFSSDQLKKEVSELKSYIKDLGNDLDEARIKEMIEHEVSKLEWKDEIRSSKCKSIKSEQNLLPRLIISSGMRFVEVITSEDGGRLIAVVEVDGGSCKI